MEWYGHVRVHIRRRSDHARAQLPIRLGRVRGPRRGGTEQRARALDRTHALQRERSGPRLAVPGAGAPLLDRLHRRAGGQCRAREFQFPTRAQVLDSGGNLFDAISIAVRAALSNTRIPKVTVVVNQTKKKRKGI